MTEQTARAPRPSARIIGVVYFLYFFTAISAEVFINGLVESGDDGATANNILARQSSFQLGTATGLIAIAFYIALTALFYHLFEPVSGTLSLLAAFFSLVGCAALAVGTIFQLAPFVIREGSPYLNVFTLDPLQALALRSLKSRPLANDISLVFFGLYCPLIGFLIFRSTFPPRILGGLMVFAGLAWLTFLSPPLAKHLSPYTQILGVLAEGSLMLWLLAMGVNVQRWKEQVSIAHQRQ